MARRRRYQEPDEEDEDDEVVEPISRARRRPKQRRWRLRLATLLVLFVGLTAAAPTIVGRLPVRNSLLAGALPASVGRISSTGGAFSWIGGQSFAGVTVVDAEGKPLFSAESVTLDRSLIGLASNRHNLGKLVLTRPMIHLDTRDGGSNLEDLFARLAEAAAAKEPTAQDEHDARRTIVEVEIVEGTVVGRDAVTGQEWRIDQLTATAMPVGEVDDWDVGGAGVLSLASFAGATPTPVAFEPTEGGPGRFKFRMHPGVSPGGGASPARRHLELMADRLPLAPIEPWLARVAPGSRVTGVASADLKLAWKPPPAINPDQPSSAESAPQPIDVLAAGKIDAADVRFTSPALSGDIVELPRAEIAIDAALSGSRFTATQFAAKSDWLQAEMNGEVDLAQLANLDMQSLPTTDASITARVDLPQLTRMLPRTLRLRPEVRVDAGSLEFTAKSQGGRDPSSRRWTVAAAMQDLVGSGGAAPIRWTQPVEFGVDVAQTAEGPQLQRALVRAPFASATADAVDEGLKGQLDFNLDELAAQLGEIIDLSAWQLHGTGKGEFTLRNTGVDTFVATAGLDLANIDVQRAGKVVWVDPELRMELQAGGRRQGLRPQRFDTATAFMRGQRDQLSVELAEPIDLAAADRDWLIKVTGNGPLDSWAGRLRPWVAAVPDELSGQSTVSALVRAREGLVHVTESKLAVDDLRTRVGTKQIIEPRVEMAGDFRWDAGAAAIESQDLTVASSTISGRARGLSLKWLDAGPPTVRGEIAFRGDFERIAAWLGMTSVEGGMWPRGEGVGKLLLASDATQATANLTMKAEALQLVRGASPTAPESIVWNEPRVEFSTEATYANAEDRLQLANLRLQGQTVQMTGSGLVEQFRTAGLVRGDVNVTYDAGELAKLLAVYLGPGVQIQGANQARIQAAGTLRAAPVAGVGPVAPDGTAPTALAHWSRRWQITTETGFAAANIHGLPIGAAKVNASIRDGQANFMPLELPVGQGRLSLTPRVLLDPPPQMLELAPGQIVSNVAISQEVTQSLLKYAAPVVANATRSEGTFSFFLESAQIPLRHPKEGKLNGRLTIHQLAVLPGPMIQQIAGLIRQVETLGKSGQDLPGLGLGLLGGAAAAPQPAQPLKGITMTERTVDVQVADGRVYHRNLEFLIDDVPVRSQGSVGFDETLAIVIEVPVQAKWVGDKPALKGLVGQVLQIPVQGTFDQPKVDERAIGSFMGQAAQTAAGGLIEGELNKALDKIFKPR